MFCVWLGSVLAEGGPAVFTVTQNRTVMGGTPALRNPFDLSVTRDGRTVFVTVRRLSRRTPSSRSSVPRAARTPRKCGRCASFKGQFLSPRAKP